MDTNEDMFEGNWGVMKAQQRKMLMRDIQEALRVHGEDRQPKIMEIFCPGRFAEQAQAMGVPERWHSGSLKWMGLESG